ncbi:MAG: hypothetical protein KDE11_03850 [Rhodobacteraceae bacterium]|nr:hypothetical protein [Paracoccaceae bacterium]
MPALVRLYIRHVAIGYALGLVFTGLLLWLDIGGLWHLIRATEGGAIAGLMLVIFNGIVFSGVQFGYAIMRMGKSGMSGGGRRVRVNAAPPRQEQVGVRVTPTP